MLTRLRKRQKGFTLIELLIVIAIIGIIAALLIPNFLDALAKAKQKRAVADVRNTGTAMFSWLTDQQGAAAAGVTTVDFSSYGGTKTGTVMATYLVPQYTNEVAAIDPWKATYVYYLNATVNRTTQMMGILSGGADKSVPLTSYTLTSFRPTDYDQDIVWADGAFIRWPEGVAGTTP